MRPCRECKNTIEVGEDSTLCTICGAKCHARCSSTSASRDLADWKCSACTGQAAANLPLNQTHFEILVSKLTLLENGISQNNSLIQAQSQQIANCVTDITDLRAENAELKNRISHLEAIIESTSMEVIYSETRNRLERESNLVINGLVESSDPQTDRLVVSEILGSILPGVESPILTLFRLGKTNPNHPRPIKVKFSNNDYPVRILRNKYKLDKLKYPSIRIKADLTKSQVEYLSGLHDELNNRKSNGENNLVIRYVNHQPMITSSNKIRVDRSNKRPREESFSPGRQTGFKVPNVCSQSEITSNE